MNQLVKAIMMKIYENRISKNNKCIDESIKRNSYKLKYSPIIPRNVDRSHYFDSWKPNDF